ncbi:hypothetical protein PIB30_092170, partial [Stylosanthes scabra]|nr:hypothetical protein [Stylosanthes scabra]
MTGSSPLFHHQRVRLGFTRQHTWGTERTQKGSTGYFGEFHDIQQLRNHTWDLFQVFVGCGKTTDARAHGLQIRKVCRDLLALPPLSLLLPLLLALAVVYLVSVTVLPELPFMSLYVYPPPRVPMMDARRYRSLFAQRRVVPPSPQRD